MSEFNEVEKQILRAIKDGQRDFMYKRGSDTKIIVDSFLRLQSLGYIKFLGASTKDRKGFTEVKLTEVGNSLDI